ncbi:MAG: hypothetical protein ACM3SY_16420 [Candidatus Omnitrophota bacterium]
MPIKKKRLPIAAMLIGIYALMMFQELVLTHVLCHKTNGDVNLEMAFFGFNCDCRESHHHNQPSLSETQPCTDLSCQSNICTDEPLNNSWLERDVNRHHDKPQLAKETVLSIEFLGNGNDRFSFLSANNHITLTKFLPHPSSLNSPSMRC